MFFKPKKNRRITPASEESMLEVAISAIALGIMGYVLTVLVFLL
jgi:hypothetical protein